MRVFDFISVKLTGYLILGILFGYYLSINPFFVAIALVIQVIVLGVLIKKQKRNGFPFFGILMAASVFCLGIFVVTLSNPTRSKSHFSNYELTQHQIVRVKVLEVLKPTSFSERYVVQVKQLDSSLRTGKLLVSFSSDSTAEKLNVDDEFVFEGKIEVIKPPLNPHQFDYSDYLNKKGIFHQVRADKSQLMPVEKPSRTLVGLASSFREGLIKKLKTYNFGNDELGVIQALLLGKRDDISESVYTDYKNAGAVHILAVSGLHVGILLLILQFVLRPLEALPRGKQIKTATIILLLWAFAFIAGLSPSVVRAVTMFSFLAYAMNLNRPSNTFNIIALSMFFILLVKPMFLFQVGFQMSYAAVLSIIWIYPKLQRFWYPTNWPTRKVWQLFSVSLAAQLGVLPISLFYFHQFPALFFVSNLIVVPFLGIILGTGVLVILLASLNILPEILGSIYNFTIKTMNDVVGWVANQEGFVFRDISFDSVQLVLAYLLIFGLVFSLSRPKFKNLALLLIAIAGLSGWGVLKQSKLNKNEQIILAHQTRNSVLLNQKGKQLQILTDDFNAAERITTAFKVGEGIKTIQFDSLENSYSMNNKSIFVVDSSTIYPTRTNVDYVLLTQSPKLNLERLIDSIHPIKILADGSNYKTYITRWKATCAKRKLPFHYTGEKGAYYFDLNNQLVDITH